MKIRIAIVTDIHASGSTAHPQQRGELAENLLLCVVNRFNRWIKPDIEFVEKCINSGAKLCLSSDNHNMYEMGELWSHLKLLEKIGVTAQDFSQVLL
jgi:hypothetical protein